jgi:4-aminobutyrate aminotransferase-like enzyme
MAVLEVIEAEGLMQHAHEVGNYVQRGLPGLQKKHELVGDVRGRGLFFGVELVRDRKTLEPAATEARQLTNAMRDRGVLISKIGTHDNILKMRPPMPFDNEHADMLVSVLDDCLAGLQAEAS